MTTFIDLKEMFCAFIRMNTPKVLENNHANIVPPYPPYESAPQWLKLFEFMVRGSTYVIAL